MALAPIAGVPVSDYLSDVGVHASGTETFVALRAEIDNWRWSGVPFFLRTGKRLPQRNSEIIVTFKQIRHSIFSEDAGPIVANKLVIRLQPDEGISQLTTMKAPGSGRIMLIPASLQLSFRAGTRVPHAGSLRASDYRRDPRRRHLVHAPRRGRSLLALDRADSGRMADPHAAATRYPAGTWGPSAAIALIERDRRSWYEDA